MQWWLFRRVLWQRKIFADPASFFSLFGIALGVAFLVVSMAGFSGFMHSLKSSIIDVTGDIAINKRGSRIEKPQEVSLEIKKLDPRITEVLGFAKLETLVAANGKISAVLLQGVEAPQGQELGEEFTRRQIEVFSGEVTGVAAPAHLGKVVAQHLKLKVGDSFKVILPVTQKSSATEIEPRVQSYYVKSLIDLGKYEFNERVVLTSMSEVQKLAEMGDRVNGFRVKVRDSEQAAAVADKIQEHLGWDYSVRDWSMTNRSLFKAIRYEKTVLFFVMLVMLVAAFFNVSTTLFLNVLRQYAQISVLRALGLKRRDVIALFCLHGLLLGSVGLVIGLILGVFFSYSFEFIQWLFPIMPEDVYKMSQFSTQLSLGDTLWVILATLLICFLSTLAPAIRGSRLSPVEGLKYE